MRRRSVIRAAFLVLAVALLVVTVVREHDALSRSLSSVSPGLIALAGILVLVGLAAQMLSWRALLATADSEPLPLRAAGRIYFVGQLGKYVPGSVWAVVAQTELGKDHRVPRARSAVAAGGALVVLLVVGTAVASAGLTIGAPGSLRAYWWALLALPVGMGLLAPPVFNRLVARGLRLARQGSVVPAMTTAPLLRSAGWALVMWLAFGAQAWVLAQGTGAHGAQDAATVAGAFALAWVVGFLVVLAPAGAGPRELALVVALGPVMDRADALVLALLSRVLMVVGDAVAAAVFVRRTDR